MGSPIAGPTTSTGWATSGRSIGSRRLAIIDLDTGRQPMTTTDGSIVISQNGEIYNYVELREELLRRGHTLATHGDTEVIGHLYQEFGDDFVDHLRGMFAIALWDKPRQRLILARDRLGKKPIYWRLADGRLSYGSEMKVILTEPDVAKDIDRQALALFLEYQYIPAPWTILRGVHKLPPASILTWDGGEPRIRRYWEPDYTTKVRRSLEEDREAALEVLRESVRLRLRSDVPVGAFLSGGMDSSTVVALMAEASSQVRTFSIGFQEKEYDELRYARAVAKHFGTDHTDEVVDLDAISLLPELADHYDEPFGDLLGDPDVPGVAARREVAQGRPDRRRRRRGVRRLRPLPVRGRDVDAGQAADAPPHGRRVRGAGRPVADGRQVEAPAPCRQLAAPRDPRLGHALHAPDVHLPRRRSVPRSSATRRPAIRISTSRARFARARPTRSTGSSAPTCSRTCPRTST